MLHIFRPSTGHCHQALAIPSHPNLLLAIHRQPVASQCHHKPSKSFTDHWHQTMHDTIHPSQSPAIPRPSLILHPPTVTSYCHQIWSSFELYFSLLRGTGQVGLWYGYASTSPGVGPPDSPTTLSTEKLYQHNFAWPILSGPALFRSSIILWPSRAHSADLNV